jgi:hypothetical protein
VGDNERDLRVLFSQQLYDRNLTHDIVEHWQGEGARDLTDLARDAPVAAVHLDAAKAVSFDRNLY